MLTDWLTSLVVTSRPSFGITDTAEYDYIPPSDLEIALRRLLSESNSGALQFMGDTGDDPKRMCKRSVSYGKSYTIRVGDVSFAFQFRRYEPHTVSVFIDQVYAMSYIIKEGMKLELKSDALDEHVLSAAKVVLGRIAAKRVERELRDLKHDAEQTEKVLAVADRFGAVRA